jgi:hypothetical protein
MPEFVAEFVPVKGLDDFTQAYLQCAEWLLDNDIDRDKVIGFAPEAIEKAKKDCEDFQSSFAEQLKKYEEATERDITYAGHDFWLTRNRHGAGFWDRGNNPVLEELTTVAHAYGEVDLYLGDDGYLYFT